MECHLAFIGILKAINLKFKNAFPILIEKYDKCKPFIGVSNLLNPIVDEIKKDFAVSKDKFWDA